jgi:hypothetical protein
MPQTRGDCSTALKFESSETVHEGRFCHVSRGNKTTTLEARKNSERIHEPTISATFTQSGTASPRTKPASALMKPGASFNPGISSNW